jgi:hypothetical protein
MNICLLPKTKLIEYALFVTSLSEPDGDTQDAHNADIGRAIRISAFAVQPKMLAIRFAEHASLATPSCRGRCQWTKLVGWLAS